MAPKTLYMETTEILPEKTAAEILSLLVQSGAKQVLQTYENGEIVGLQFTIDVNGMNMPFKMPARVDPILKIIRSRGKHWQRNAKDDLLKAKRVAWRQLYRWIQAQLALIETGMVSPQEVFMPYMQVSATETLYDRALASGFRALLPETTTVAEIVMD